MLRCGVAQFARCRWHPGHLGVPILTDCPRWFVGTIVDRVDGGNHTGFLLAPVTASGEPEPAQLMFSAVKDLDAGHEA